jgi:hypothetical protein
VHATDVTLEMLRHKPQAAHNQYPMRLFFIYPEVLITASLFVEKEVAERRMVQTDGVILVFSPGHGEPHETRHVIRGSGQFLKAPSPVRLCR